MLLQGIAAASGYAIGKAFVMQEQATAVERKDIGTDAVEAEVERFQNAVQQAMDELEQIKENTAAKLGERSCGNLRYAYSCLAG